MTQPSDEQPYSEPIGGSWLFRSGPNEATDANEDLYRAALGAWGRASRLDLENPFQIGYWASVRTFWQALSRTVLIGIVLLGLGLAALAYTVKEGSFGQSLAEALSVGCFTFLLAPLVLASARARKNRTRAWLVRISVGLATIAYIVTGPTRELMLGLAVDLVLLCALDITVEGWLERIKHAAARAEEKRRAAVDADQQFHDDDPDDDFPFRIAGHGFGDAPDPGDAGSGGGSGA